MEDVDSSQQRLPRFQLRASAIMGVIEQAVVGVCNLGVYALVLRRLGVEDLSVLSLVQMATVIAFYFSYPSSNTLVHHIARSESQGERKRSVAMVETAVVMVAGIYGAVCLCGYFPFLLLMRHTVPDAKLDLVGHLMPVVFASIFLMNLASVYLFTLAAMHKMYMRSAFDTLATLLMVTATVVLFPTHGLMAAAIGLLYQQTFRLIAGATMVKINLPEIRLFMPRFQAREARSMLALGVPMQIVTLSSLFWEPYTRLILGFVGAIAPISYFTIAWRIVLIPRSFLNSAMLALAPTFGSMDNRFAHEREYLQRTALDLVFCVTPVVTAAAIGVSPIASEILFGSFQPELVLFTTWIALGYFWEELSQVFYLRSLGEGRLLWTASGYLVISVVNILVGGLLAWKFGAKGAIVGISLALGLGAMVVLFGNQRMFGVPSGQLMTRANFAMVIASSLAAAACLIIYALVRQSMGLWPTIGLMALVAGIIVAIPAVRHPIAGLIVPYWLALKSRGKLRGMRWRRL